MSPGFWDDHQKASRVVSEIARQKEYIAAWDGLRKDVCEALEHARTARELEAGEGVAELVGEAEKNLKELRARFAAEERTTYFSGKYDRLSATLSVFSGAGGRDAADWASMLVRMFARFAERQGWKVRRLHEHQDPEGGIKSVTLEISGTDVYGVLRFETGVHRLVRISPFDANKRRHTSFAMVEALPVLEKENIEEQDIKAEDLLVETFRSSGPGGQNVNRRETAVRVRHKPTGLVAECQSERLQGENKNRAVALLAAKLAAMKEETQRKEVSALRGEKTAVAWGNQIRSYVLHPYTMVKDHRTGTETSQVEDVLDGNLDEFINAEVQQLGLDIKSPEPIANRV